MGTLLLLKCFCSSKVFLNDIHFESKGKLQGICKIKDDKYYVKKSTMSIDDNTEKGHKEVTICSH